MATLQRILELVRRETQAGETDQIRLVIDGKDLDYCVQLPFMPSHELTTLRILRHLEAIVQSKREFFLNGEMTVLVYHVRNLQGRGISKLKRFNQRKCQEPLPWLKTLATRGWVVVCGGKVSEATAQYLHWRVHGTPFSKSAKQLLADMWWVEAHVRATGAEAIPVLLQHYNEMLRREKGIRVVVLDWNHDDRPYFVGEGREDDEVMFLYKVNDEFHLLLHPEKIHHSDAKKSLCYRCFFFFLSECTTKKCACLRQQQQQCV